jgi:hypothetical protein
VAEEADPALPLLVGPDVPSRFVPDDAEAEEAAAAAEAEARAVLPCAAGGAAGGGWSLLSGGKVADGSCRVLRRKPQAKECSTSTSSCSE